MIRRNSQTSPIFFIFLFGNYCWVSQIQVEGLFLNETMALHQLGSETQ